MEVRRRKMPEEKEKKKAPDMPKADAKEIEEGKMFAAVGYLGILFLIPLLAAKENKFAQYHAKQGMLLFIVGIVVLIVSAVFLFVPCLGWAIALILCLGWLALAIMGIVKSLQGEYWKMPVLGGWAEQLNF
jgi:uncharacterized membrane protein